MHLCYQLLEQHLSGTVIFGRSQTDKIEYSRMMRSILESTPNLDIREGQAVDVVVDSNDEVVGVRTFFGVSFRAKGVVLTTGTFMNGRIWVGRRSMEAGRAGEAPSKGLTEALVALGFETGERHACRSACPASRRLGTPRSPPF